MSLIQEALEKAGGKLDEKKKEAPSQAALRARLELPNPQVRPVSRAARATPSELPVQKRKPLMAAALEEKSGGSSKAVFFLWSGLIAVVVLSACYILIMEVRALSSGGEASRQNKNEKAVVREVVSPFAEATLQTAHSSVAGISFHLSGITSSGGEMLALINNQIVTVGDILRENAMVKEINPQDVLLLYGEVEIRLKLS